MAYIQARTAPTFGNRSQALGWYERASFPLPTTSLSRVIRRGRGLGWYNGPYPLYRQPEQSRTRGFVPLGSFVSRDFQPAPGTEHQGTVTYRIDPRTGKYKFSAVDILPRGIFAQNTFQHPATPAISPVGLTVPASGGNFSAGGISQGPLSPGFQASLLPGVTLSGLGLTRGRRRRRGRLSGCCSSCACGGSCSGLGDDTSGNGTFTDPSTGCVMDSDGNLLTCPGGVDPYQSPTISPGTLSTCQWDANGNLVPGSPAVCAPTAPAQAPTVSAAGPSAVTPRSGTPAGAPVQFILNTAPQAPTIAQNPAAAAPSLFSGSTAGIPNTALALGAGLLAVMALHGGGGRRR